ncbi:MAG: PLP-dependent aminotransferase family protein [Lachnospiraceae bacterium]|nr:PLP-dependent aminotransferase family protein [Lachnospiraceae bacterium]
MLTITLDPHAPTPIYLQLYSAIKDRIIRKELAPDTILPSKRALALHLGVSIKTIENAYSQLLMEGYIYSIEKKGFYVSLLDDYRTRKEPPRAYVSRFAEDTYPVDLKSNKHALSDFPSATWCRLMRETLSAQSEQLFDTVPFNGVPRLRIAIARYLHDFRGMDVSPDQIIVGAGTEYLYGRLIQLLGQNAHYAIEDPGYNKIRAIYKSNGASYTAVPVDREGIRMDLLNRSAANIVHISPAHHFPLGFVTPITRRLELLQWVNAAAGRYIIEDDYDSEYRYRGVSAAPLYSIDIRNKVIYMNTFSKSVSPAVRISYMVLPEPLMDQYISTLNFYSCTVSSFEQYTLADFIEGGYLERHINRMKRRGAAARDMLIHMITHSPLNPRVHIKEDAAGSHILLKLQTDLEDTEVISRLRSAGILVSAVSDCCEKDLPEYHSTLIVNYSGITEKQAGYFVEHLSGIVVVS